MILNLKETIDEIMLLKKLDLKKKYDIKSKEDDLGNIMLLKKKKV